MIDDTPFDKMLTESLLSKQVILEQVSDIKKGIRSINYKEPDIILLDIEMPNGESINVLKELKDKEHIPIIFLTVKQEHSALDDSLNNLHQIKDYLVKPIMADKLLSSISKVYKEREFGFTE